MIYLRLSFFFKSIIIDIFIIILRKKLIVNKHMTQRCSLFVLIFGSTHVIIDAWVYLIVNVTFINVPGT